MEQIDVAVIGGGQSGPATAHALRARGLQPVVLEASEQAAGSWPACYDSLTLFSPARYSSLPGMPFGGDPDRYPHRDEVVTYLLRYADRLDADIRTRARVREVRTDNAAFTLDLEGGGRLSAWAVVAASGTFGRPYRPVLPGLDTLTGQLLHAADYRSPEPFAGQRVVIVGAGNSAVQIAAELAERARVTPAARHPVRFARQRILGRDLHWWLARTGVDRLPIGRFLRTPPTRLVIDDGRYRAAVAAGAPDRRPVFTRIDGAKVTWMDGAAEEVDAILPATGHRLPAGPELPRPTRRPRRARWPAPPGRPLARAPRTGVRRTGVAAQPVVQLPAWRGTRCGQGRRLSDPVRGSPLR